jgi:hypothetical protein
MGIERVSITPHPEGWAVKHGEGYLGHARSEEEAVLIGRDLVDWLTSQGRTAELMIERRPQAATRGVSQ